MTDDHFEYGLLFKIQNADTLGSLYSRVKGVNGSIIILVHIIHNITNYIKSIMMFDEIKHYLEI